LDMHYRVHKPLLWAWMETANDFRSPRGITLSKMAWLYQNRTWLRYSYDKPAYQISFQYVQLMRRKWTETANYWNFLKSKGHNSVKNGSIVPKTELDQDILMINVYTKFHFNMCKQCEENERKLCCPSGIQQQSNMPSLLRRGA
jgi:hypothetical protein